MAREPEIRRPLTQMTTYRANWKEHKVKSLDYANFKTPLSHPGAHLREDFLPDYEMTASDLAQAIGISNSNEIHDLLSESVAITASIALRLGKLFGTSAEFWMNLQMQHDLSREAILLRDKLEQIAPIRKA